MKIEWKKDDKQFYLPKNKPEKIFIPAFNFFTINGKGNPNDDFFAEYIQVLYALSYAVKMSPKSGKAPANYQEYTVYPLEGVWDIDDESKKTFSGVLDKNKLVFTLMMRQPDFVSREFAMEMIETTKKKKALPLLDHVNFETIEEGNCVQMLHLGSYDDEAASFSVMKKFTLESNLNRTSMVHREIYLSDARKVSPDKLKTVLRFCVH